MTEMLNATEKLGHFLWTQNYWKPVGLLGRGNHLIEVPILVKGPAVEESERRHGDHDRTGCQFLFPYQMDLIVADVLEGQMFGGLAKMPCEQGNLKKVGGLGLRGQI